MANIQRLLGTMLASRMAGRGGMGGALGGAAMMGLGGPLLRSKAGLAAMGYLAYRAYKKNQANTAGHQNVQGGIPEHQNARAGMGTGGGGGLGGALGAAGLGGALGGIVDQLTGGRSGGGGASSQSIGDRIAAALDGKGPEPAPEETMSEDKALLLIRAMVTAANSDGVITPEERARISGKVEEAGADAEDKRLIERELANPRSLDELLRVVNDQETAQQFYFASRAAIEGGTPTERSYLDFLRQRLNLPQEDVEAAESLAR